MFRRSAGTFFGWRKRHACLQELFSDCAKGMHACGNIFRKVKCCSVFPGAKDSVCYVRLMSSSEGRKSADGTFGQVRCRRLWAYVFARWWLFTSDLAEDSGGLDFRDTSGSPESHRDCRKLRDALNRGQNHLMDTILFWALIAVSMALTGMILAKYVGGPGASAIMGLVLWVAWIAGFSRLFESVRRLGQLLVAFVLSLF